MNTRPAGLTALCWRSWLEVRPIAGDASLPSHMKPMLVFLALVAGLLLPACTQEGPMSEKQIETLVNQSLKIGDSAQKIEAFLATQRWPFSYDKYQKRYQTHYPAGEKNNAVSKSGVAIWIYVDDNRAFSKVVVERIYTVI